MNRKTKIAVGVVALAALPGVAFAVKALDRPPSTRAEVAAEAAERFAEQDEDKDGRLIVRRRPAPREAAPPPAEDLAASFAALDTNHDGQLSGVEFAAMPRRDDPPAGPGGRHGPGPRGPGPLERADANGDGFVTLAELRTEALARFDADDVNRDGKLSEEERRAAGPPHRGPAFRRGR